MAAANYQSSKETTNFARICRLVIDVIPDLFRDLLIARLASTGLTYVLTNQKGQVFPLLNRQQKKILYPQGGLFQGSVKDLDTSLLYILLRNLGNIPPHQNGWGKVPGIADRSLSANIDRLREQRNEAYAHAPNASLSDGEFQARWDIIRQSVEEIQNSELNTGRFVVAVDTTFTMRMDPSTEKNFITLIAQIEVEISDIKMRQVAITADVDNLKGKMAGMSVKQEAMQTGMAGMSVKQDAMQTDMAGMSVKQDAMQTDMAGMSVKQDAMQTDMAGMSVKQDAMQTDMAGMSVKQDAMQTDMAGMSVKQDAMQTDMADLQGHIREEFGAVRGAVGAVRGAVGAVRDAVGAVRDEFVKEQLNISANRGRDPKLSALIETTTARIMNEKEYKYTPTKSFSDARKKLMKNRVVVIKGNSGDGKTSIALELLRLLCHDVEDGQQRLQPLELHDIKDLDLVAPMSQLVIYLDDIFGKNVVCKQDVEEWEKRVESVIESKLCGNEHAEGNFLIITIRSGIFNSLNKSCLEKVFIEQNTVVLNINAKEKLGLLRLYKPKDNFVSWKESEEKEIVKCAPDIGFPQCCRLFRDSPALQTERVNFFKRPFHFLKSSLSKLEDGKCYGLMYLFLKGGKVMEDDLDSHNENIDQNVLKAAFEVDVVEVTPTTELVHNRSMGRKIEFVKKSLDSLLGWLVKKEPNDKQRVCYQFNHDSIEETLALLYGEKTPIGYIQNCPCKFLSYVTTSKTTPNKVVISSDNQYNVLYKRLLREFESVYSSKRKSDRFYSKYHSITSLDVWTDFQFLQGFIRWLSDKNVDKNLCNEIKLALLNGACSSGSEECVSFLLSEGVKPEKETMLCVVEGGRVNILYKVEGIILQSLYKDKCETVEGHVVHRNCVFAQDICQLVNERGQTVLHYSCYQGHMEVCKYLCESYPALTTAVTNNGATVLHSSCYQGHMEVCKYLCESYPALTTAVDNNGKTVLHHSCYQGHMEVCKYLCESYPALTTAVDNNGETVLHYSCHQGHMEKIIEDKFAGMECSLAEVKKELKVHSERLEGADFDHSIME
ncbi:uncharacterized protein LOC110447178 [Mizuhopecten yessoensis]|uniref:uncharacterized protein LOC110447178 n=1 Tax=Mizuhopecten yessoensis TaxID=6573 RepID=UPI000B45DAFB|nr:uncharacterized protein LOC110447178 [Mizuhopecten yessoensis]